MLLEVCLTGGTTRTRVPFGFLASGNRELVRAAARLADEV